MNKNEACGRNEYVPFISEVEEFNAAMDKPNNYSPVIPSKKEWQFVVDFIREETAELEEACKNGDIVEILDALCDLTVVSLGNGAMLFGLKDRILDAYAEVHASNMSKACRNEEIAKASVKAMEEKYGEPYYYEKVGDKYVTYRKRDKKVGKSIEYFRPNLKKFFTEEEIQKCHDDVVKA